MHNRETSVAWYWCSVYWLDARATSQCASQPHLSEKVTVPRTGRNYRYYGNYGVANRVCMVCILSTKESFGKTKKWSSLITNYTTSIPQTVSYAVCHASRYIIPSSSSFRGCLRQQCRNGVQYTETLEKKQVKEAITVLCFASIIAASSNPALVELEDSF